MRNLRLLSLLLLVPVTLGAQFSTRSTAPAQGETDTAVAVAPPVVDSTSPRAALARYLNAARSGDFATAAQWIDQSSPGTAERAPELAKRLKAVLDSRLWIDMERVSGRAEGNTEDGLPRDREELGTIALDDGNEVPIRLARTGRGGDRTWVFSDATIDQVDALYAELPDRWIREHLPESLLRSWAFDILYWQWIALLILVPLAMFVGLTLARPTRWILRKVVAKTDSDFDDRLLLASRGPIILLWAVFASRILLQWIALPAPVQSVVVEVQKGLAVIAIFWVILRGIGVVEQTLPQMKWSETHPALRSLVPLGARIARLLVVAIAFLTIISMFGYPIATILAGLGIGGIAIALGAQKSLEHFFGSVSIGVDQPFRVGDWVSVNGVQGGVEAIGLRSTQIRTLDRTLVSMPNGQLAESVSENFGQRDRFLLKGTVGVEYGTSVATLKVVRDAIERALRAHPKTWPERVQVAFCNFGAFSLDIEFFCWLEVEGIDDFRSARQEIFFAVMEAVEGNGAGFAFPTQTLHLVRAGEPDGPAALSPGREPPRGSAG